MKQRTLEIPGLSDEQMHRLAEKARRAGSDPAGYVRGLITQDLDSPSLDEILAPIRQGFADSGAMDAELTTLFEEARDEVWQEWRRQGKA